MNPTPYHKNFLRVGRMFTKMVTPAVRLDLPDVLTIPTGRPVLFAGNHRSLFDFIGAMAIFTKFNMSSRLLIRADLVNGRFGGPLFQTIGSIATSSEHRQDAEDAAVEALLSGQLVSMMPEGRLVPATERGELGVGPGRAGVSRIARRAGACVIPVAFGGSEVVWPRGRAPQLHLRRPTVAIRTGDPLELTSDDHQANADELMTHLGALVRRLEHEQRSTA